MAYFGPGSTPSPKTVVRWRAELREFRTAYIPYVNATLPALQNGGSIAFDSRRQEVVRLATVASRAMARSGVTPYIYPPPARGGPVLHGLVAAAFAHEDERFRATYFGFGPPPKSTPELTLESIDAADAQLAVMQSEAARRYRSPFFWIDRVLRAVLGFPAYLLSVILGFEPDDLGTAFQRILWIVSVCADLAALYGLATGLHLFGL